MTDPHEVFTEKGLLEKNLCMMEETLIDDKNKDMVVLVIGQPGSSKSSLTLLAQLALRGKIQYENMAFTHDQYMDAAKKGGKNKVIQYDEGRDSFYKRRAMSSSNTEAMDMLNQYRFKGHIHFINFQNLTDMELDLVYKRCHAVIRTPRQGFFHFYNQKQTRKIDVDKQTRKVEWPQPSFVGRFPDPANEYPQAWKKYNETLEEKLDDEEDTDDDADVSVQEVKDSFRKTVVKELYEKTTLSTRDLSHLDCVNRSQSTIANWVKEDEEEEDKTIDKEIGISRPTSS